MTAGIFRTAGYFMGEQAYSGNIGNPKGYFEDKDINLLNEDILSKYVPRRRGGKLGRWGDWLFRRRPGRLQKWLAKIPADTEVRCTPAIHARIAHLCAHEPFCYKDPRFSYTLPCWLPHLKRTRFLVVFRHPAETATSVLKICRTQQYLWNLVITRDDVFQIWELMYRHILKAARGDGTWLFMHYRQVLTAQGLDRLASFAEAPVDRTFPDPRLERSISIDPVPAEAASLYRQLCDLAHYEEPSPAG